MNKGVNRTTFESTILADEIVAYIPALKAYAISMTRNQVRADDLVQQTMLKALSKLEQFQRGTNLKAWLFTILHNQYFSEYRKVRREDQWNPVFENSLAFSTGSIGSGAESTYEFHQLLLYLVCLPPDQSDALIAIGYLGMSYDEAADRFACAVGTVKSRVNRARVELSALMKGARIQHVDLTKLKNATRGVPQTHPYYPIAQAYEELYASCDSVDTRTVRETSGPIVESTKSDELWNDLVASGALDEREDLDTLIRRESE